MNPDSAPKVRRAVPADAFRLAHLRYEFRVALLPAAELEDEFVARCVPWMEQHLANELAWRAYVVEANRAIVGNVWVQLIEKMPNPVGELARHAYLTNFFVQSAHRNGGAGSALLTALLTDCDVLGVDATFLWPTARGRPLYERHGFSAENRVMVRSR